jgi:type I restriction enzyme S subunit
MSDVSTLNMPQASTFLTDWMPYRLTDLAHYYNGVAFKPADWSEDGLPIIRIEQLNNPNGEFDRYLGSVAEINYIRNGDLIFSWSATLKVLLWRNGDAVLNQYLFKVTPKSGHDLQFIYFLLDYYMESLGNGSHGSTMKHIKRSELDKFFVRVPNLAGQLKIATILTSIDTAIEKTEALIEKCQQIKAGLMQDLFTRGVLPNGQLRPPRDQAPELYQETSVGWIPKDWDLRILSSVADVLDPQPDHRTPPESLEGIPYVGIGDFDLYHELSLSSCRKIIVKAYEKQRQRFLVEESDVIYGKIGTIGQPKRLPFGGYAVSANVVLLKPKIDSLYFYYAVNSRAFDKQVSNITNTTSQPALGIEKVRNLIIPFPEGVEASKIGTSLHGVAIKISKERRHLDKLKMRKLGLMQDLLTGKVPVKVDDQVTEAFSG